MGNFNFGSGAAAAAPMVGADIPGIETDITQGGAEAGAFFSEGELPIVAVPGGMPMVLGGFSPSPERDPQVSIDQDPRGVGVTAPPSGIRR